MRNLAVALLGLAFLLPAGAADEWAVRRVTGEYEFVRDDLQQAILERGFVINNVAQVGNMLERTGADLGRAKRLYGRAEVFEFCSADHSRRLMEEDVRYIVFCPFTIALYTLPDEAERVYVAFRRLPRDTAAQRAVDDLLAAIVRDTVK